MYLEATQRPTYALHINARLIAASKILQYSADEFEHAIRQEQEENVLLAVTQHRLCHTCGARLYGQDCGLCQAEGRRDTIAPVAGGNDTQAQGDTWQNSDRRLFTNNLLDDDGDERSDPLAHIASGQNLVDDLLQQLQLLIAPEDAAIAEMLVGNLNERGYLEVSIQEVGEWLAVSVARVEYVLEHLQSLEPRGIGARDLRECLLIQLDAISEDSPTLPPLCRMLVERHLDQLGGKRCAELARQLRVPEREVEQAKSYIRTTLHPFPAYLYNANIPYAHLTRPPAASIRPDILILKRDGTFEIELLEEQRYAFHVDTTSFLHGEVRELRGTNKKRDTAELYVQQYTERAKAFVDCVQRRWQTLRHIMALIVESQRLFLEWGPRYLAPLTRAHVAHQLGLDESTVSRAVVNKYALLPAGRLVPLATFFDGSLGPKDLLQAFISAEQPGARLNDEQLADLLTAHGITLARRTVTKYRRQMGIASSHERTAGVPV